MYIHIDKCTSTFCSNCVVTVTLLMTVVTSRLKCSRSFAH